MPEINMPCVTPCKLFVSLKAKAHHAVLCTVDTEAELTDGPCKD